jgi:ligand-binding sensor domain-containing protein
MTAAREDFNNNLELVSIWIDHDRINCMCNDCNDNKWIATDNGITWLERILDYKR